MFAAAAASGRAVVLLDELDALAPARGGEGTGERPVETLLRPCGDPVETLLRPCGDPVEF